jgi:hypothetical protein
VNSPSRRCYLRSSTGLHRCEDEGAVVQLVLDGEGTALFNVSELLERELVEPLQRNYSELADQVRIRLTGEE